MAYLLIVGYRKATKNQLQQAVEEYFLQQDRTYFEDQELENFKAKLEMDTDRINEQHSRCKEIKFSYYKSIGSGDIHLHDLTFNATIYRIKQDYEHKGKAGDVLRQ